MPLAFDRIRFKTKLLEVAGVGGFALGQHGHQFAVGLRPNPGKQVVDAIDRFLELNSKIQSNRILLPLIYADEPDRTSIDTFFNFGGLGNAGNFGIR